MIKLEITKDGDHMTINVYDCVNKEKFTISNDELKDAETFSGIGLLKFAVDKFEDVVCNKTYKNGTT